MNSVTSGSKAPIKGYPKLMMADSDGAVVLFSRGQVGVVVHAGCDDEPLGFYSASWDMYCFKDYDGSVTLSNGD